MRNRSTIRILKHHRTSDVYIDASGRYLHVSMKISLRSKKGRSIARETAQTILAALVGTDPQPVIVGQEQGTGQPIIEHSHSSIEGAAPPDIDRDKTDLWDGVEERDRDRDDRDRDRSSSIEGSRNGGS